MPDDELLACKVAAPLRRYLREACTAAQAADEPAPDVSALLAAVRAEIDAAEQTYIRATTAHTHRWSDDDYCTICGRDGRS